MKRLIIGLAALVAIAFAAAWIGSPWLAAWDLLRAAQARNVPALMAHVDLPAVRASLKGQIDDRLERKLAKRAAKGDPLAELGVAFGAALVDKAVDATVTPETLAEIVRTARAPDAKKPEVPPPDADGSPGEGDAAAKPPKIRTAFVMTGLNTFDIRLSPEDEPQTRLILIMHRQGLFVWKVTEIRLPD